MNSKPQPILDCSNPGEYSVGQSVKLIIHSETDLGIKAIVEGRHWGVLYSNEVFQDLTAGQEITGYIKKIREDGKLDLILYQAGNKDAKPMGEQILAKLHAAGGILKITDKTPAEEIYNLFGISKKKFKIALGGLYKQRLIQISDDHITLSKTQPTSKNGTSFKAKAQK